ncbi:hypothetical protein [Enterobacter pseudoroggenkampii]|uniref:hypothetical protein n=1 Tax=Enterobacter pseudoroggenkampii TaxID=2996112 RepID=UPI0022651C21|nr:hypothetical protein [Enterobacter pseudoroggenkampii]MCX8289125.1 hypothetical protein [Enterobacter pseudoroggenkampii]
MSSKYKVGDILESSKCGKFAIKEYVNSNRVYIQFLNTGYCKFVSTSAISHGQIKDPYTRSIYGVGYLGEGVNASVNGRLTREYNLWKNILERCYSEKKLSLFPSYRGCTISERWQNYQNFISDIPSLEGYDMWLDPANKYQLDKDIKFPGNKIYSVATCKFVSDTENSKDAVSRRLAKSK